MGMASVSWLYLFNIQVRANCTTACNIQAALQYVELTHVSSSVSLFFLYLFRRTKKKKKKIPKKAKQKNKHMCMQLGTSSEVMLGPFAWWEGPVGPTEDEALVGVGVPTGRPGWLRFTFTETHKEVRPFCLLGNKTE